MLNENPYFRCNSTSKCLENVKTRSSAYAAVILFSCFSAPSFGSFVKLEFFYLNDLEGFEPFEFPASILIDKSILNFL